MRERSVIHIPSVDPMEVEANRIQRDDELAQQIHASTYVDDEWSPEKRAIRSFGIANLSLHGEDNYYADGNFFGVFDGLGGHGHGDRASSLARDTLGKFAQALSARERPKQPEEIGEELAELFVAMKEALIADSREHPERTRMATTATVALIVNDAHFQPWMIYAHYGDTRIYVLRGGNLTQVTVDHGEGSHLTKAITVGMPNEARNVDFEALKLQSGDKVLVCSDGITGDYGRDILTDEEIVNCISEGSPGEAAQKLAQRARKWDDRTAIVVPIE